MEQKILILTILTILVLLVLVLIYQYFVKPRIRKPKVKRVRSVRKKLKRRFHNLWARRRNVNPGPTYYTEDKNVMKDGGVQARHPKSDRDGKKSSTVEQDKSSRFFEEIQNNIAEFKTKGLRIAEKDRVLIVDSISSNVSEQIKKMHASDSTKYKKEIDELAGKCSKLESDLKKEKNIKQEIQDCLTQREAELDEERKKCESAIRSLDSSKTSFWPEVFSKDTALEGFLCDVRESFYDGNVAAPSLYAEMVKLGSNFNNIQAVVNQVTPLSKVLYSWIDSCGKSEKQYDMQLALWLSECISSTGLTVRALQPGETYNNAIHDCSNPSGSTVSKVLSFLILGSSGRTELKAVVEAG